uniref:hypothetical protein n=1 Tax=Nonomuraea bangladeshensis TaxID=404385 RepID=UPI003F4908F7
MRTHPRELTVRLLAALIHEREQEITDTLVELLVATVHRIKARADSKVTKELINAFKRVTGKENILFKVADAALGHPDDPVRQVIFPAVTGGEQTLKDLVHEFKTKGPAYCTTVKTTLRASYTNHYRRGPIALLDTLKFGRLAEGAHWEIERHLRESGLAWSVLQPSGFMQNFVTGAGSFAADGRLPGAYGDGAVSYVDCAAVLLTGP